MKFLNQKGFTLPEVLIGAALMGGVALITAKLMGDQANNQVYLRTLASISTAVSLIENNIQNPATCRGIFAGKPLNVSAFTLGTSAVDSNVLTFVNSAGVTKSILGEKDYGDFTIGNNAITLMQSSIAPSIADLSITFTPKSKSSFFAVRSTLTKKISFVVSKSPTTGLIVGCGSVLGNANVSAKKTFCDSLGGAAVWDGDPVNKCRLLSVKCPYGQVGTKLTSIGGIVCEDLASQVDLLELFDTNPVNCLNKPKLQIVNSGNKFKINCSL